MVYLLLSASTVYLLVAFILWISCALFIVSLKKNVEKCKHVVVTIQKLHVREGENLSNVAADLNEVAKTTSSRKVFP